MGDVLAAADVLVHSSAGLTVLEAIIRGCPVVSYGFGYGHVRASNAAMERFKLAQVARRESDLKPAIARALEQRPEPDDSFARQPPTASLIMSDERRICPVPAWRLRTARAATTLVAAAAVAVWALSTGTSYSLVSHFAHIRPVTAVATDRAEVGVIVDAPGSQIAALASDLSGHGIRASFAVDNTGSVQASSVTSFNDQALPRLPQEGLVRWLSTRGQLHRLVGMTGGRHHFLYATSGPSLGQWLFAHHAGGRLVAGAVQLHDADDTLGDLRPGEVVELRVSSEQQLQQVLGKLVLGLHEGHLAAVPVGQLMRDAGTAA
jgi:hypothetical protein